MHATEDDRVRVCSGRLATQPEARAGEVRDVLDLRHLVVVRQDDRVLLLRERANFTLQRGKVFESQKWLHGSPEGFRHMFRHTACEWMAGMKPSRAAPKCRG